jgi:hypothetical protein
MTPTQGHAPFDDLEPWGYGDRDETPVLVFGLELALPVVVLGVMLAGLWTRHLRAARAAAIETSAAHPPLTPGEAVVRGVVVEVDGGEHAVRVTVLQTGSESKGKHGWKTSWRDHERRTEARPFVIELADGRRLRVEPGSDPRLIDDLEPFRRIDATTRAASATLERGETVAVRGEIVMARDAQAGYRGGEALVLRPPRGKPMLLSTHDLGAPDREAAGHLARWARRLAIGTAIVQLFALPYHASLWFGETRSATIEQRWITNVKRKNRVDQEHFVRYRVAGQTHLVQERVGDEDYPQLTVGRIVPVRVSPIETTIGPHPTLHGMLAIMPMLGLCALMVYALYGGFRARLWFERRLDAEVDGRLSEQS